MLRRVEGTDAARSTPHVDEIHITAKTDQLLEPLPEGASYLGFIFARAPERDAVLRALEDAHSKLHFEIAAPLPIVG
jgi:hypothetical protein